jgi:Integrin beta cytoplasmic domain
MCERCGTDDMLFVCHCYSSVTYVAACLKRENIIYVVIGVVVSILAVGLTLLFTWKVFVTLHDRREYARFEEEKHLANFGSVLIFEQLHNTYNPIHCSTITTKRHNSLSNLYGWVLLTNPILNVISIFASLYTYYTKISAYVSCI